MDFFRTPPKTILLFLSNVFPEDCPDEDDILENIAAPQNDAPLLYDGPEPSELFTNDFSSSDDEPLPQFYECDNKNFTGDEYDELPKYFIDIAHWPKSVNLLCWSCSNLPLGAPWFVPITKFRKTLFATSDAPDAEYLDTQNIADTENITRIREMKALKPHGCFCDEFCVKRYIMRVNDPKIVNKWEVIALLNDEYYLFTGKRAIEIPEADDPMIQMRYAGPSGISPQEYRLRNSKKNVILAE
jgi:hypothetical protein